MDFLDIVERSYTGEKVAKEDWDIDYVIMNCRDILDEFDLDYNDGDVIAYDDETLKRFYAAGRKLALACGAYNQNTGRVIKLTEEEIDQAAAGQLKEMTVGQGADAFYFYARKPEDSRKPGVVAGNPGCPMDIPTFKATVESWAKEPSIDMVTCGSIVDVYGHTVRGGEPSEVIALKEEMKALNEVCAKVGRPYIGRLAGESSVTHIGDLTAFGSGIREGDAHLTALNNELITTTDNLCRAAASVGTGVHNATLACVMVGGFAGNAAGAAVCMIASMLVSNVIYRVDYHLCHPIHIKNVATTTRECMWLQSVVNQAFALCAPNIIINDIYPKSGAGTKELLYEVAANAIEITVSGGHLEGCGSCDGVKPNCSGLECRLMGEVAKAASKQGLTRKQGEEMIQKLFAKYEHIFEANINEGLPFSEVYDLNTIEPLPFWQKMYEDVVEELKEMGLAL